MPALTKQTLQDLAGDRQLEDYMLDLRSIRVENMQEWKTRIDLIDALYRGDFRTIFPDESAKEELPKIINLVQVGLEDISRLVSESVPAVRFEPLSDEQKEMTRAQTREAICHTYWEENRSELLVPRLAMDLAGAGAAFLLGYAQDDFDYPKAMRLDPRFCYPTMFNGEIQDLVMVSRMKARTLQAITGLDLVDVKRRGSDTVEVIAYYGPEEYAEMAVLLDASQSKRPISGAWQWIKSPRKHGLGRVPVAMAQLDSFDGAFRGMFDQITGPMVTQNRITEVILEHADQAVSAPIFEHEIQNPEDYGPGAIIHAKPGAQDPKYARVGPPEIGGFLFPLLQSLQQDSRGGIGYPEARQGNVSQSIASASFVNSTMGQLTTTVRNIQRLLAHLRFQWNHIAMRIDERELNRDKPLCRPVGTKRSYIPAKDINGYYQHKVVYGGGAGLDKGMQTVRALQLWSGGRGLFPKELAMELVEEITDPVGAMKKIQREVLEDALLQRFAQTADLDQIMQAVTLMGDGKSLVEVSKEMQEEARRRAEAQQKQAQGAQAAPAEPGAPSPEDILAQELALQNGAIPSGEDNQVEFGQVPSQIIVAPGR